MTNLHRCVDCAYWQPAFTYFGEPTGRGGCQFSVARNRKGDKLRECKHFQARSNFADNSYEPLPGSIWATTWPEKDA